MGVNLKIPFSLRLKCLLAAGLYLIGYCPHYTRLVKQRLTNFCMLRVPSGLNFFGVFGGYADVLISALFVKFTKAFEPVKLTKFAEGTA